MFKKLYDQKLNQLHLKVWTPPIKHLNARPKNQALPSPTIECLAKHSNTRPNVQPLQYIHIFWMLKVNQTKINQRNIPIKQWPTKTKRLIWAIFWSKQQPIKTTINPIKERPMLTFGYRKHNFYKPMKWLQDYQIVYW